ncbi:MAG: FitA-like ribbon-helix-helix domain-containing protein [Dermatophilaceae bacterium]
MSMLQIRNVPDDIHRRLKSRAALAGVSLSELALSELRRSLERPTRRELLARVADRERTTGGEDAVDAVRAERDAR